MLEFNGTTYARVTEVLQPLNNFEKISPQVLSAKADLGTRVHAAIDDHIQGKIPFPPKNGTGYFLSFLRWQSNTGAVATQTEQRYFSDSLRLTGQIDALVKFPPDGEQVLVDFKTSSAESPTWPLQAHLYAHLIRESGACIGDRYLFVKLDKDGGNPKVFEYKHDPEILSRALSYVDLFWEENSVIKSKGFVQ